MSTIPPHILVIDDDPSILELMRMVLETEGGYRVTTAEIIFEEVSQIEQLQPDLILLDFLLQGRQLGWTFLQKLKLHRSTATIPIILCTAALSDVLEQEPILMQKGIPILYKPFDIDDLLHLVSQTLSSSQKQ